MKFQQLTQFDRMEGINRHVVDVLEVRVGVKLHGVTHYTEAVDAVFPGTLPGHPVRPVPEPVVVCLVGSVAPEGAWSPPPGRAPRILAPHVLAEPVADVTRKFGTVTLLD